MHSSSVRVREFSWTPNKIIPHENTSSIVVPIAKIAMYCTNTDSESCSVDAHKSRHRLMNNAYSARNIRMILLNIAPATTAFFLLLV